MLVFLSGYHVTLVVRLSLTNGPIYTRYILNGEHLHLNLVLIILPYLLTLFDTNFQNVVMLHRLYLLYTM